MKPPPKRARPPAGLALAALALGLGIGTAPAGRAAAPAGDTPADYSHSLPLSAGGKGGVTALRLPPAVYLHARSADLNDLRLFDRDGNRLAFALQAAPVQARTGRQELPVTIFPLPGAASAAAARDEGGGLDIRTGPDGSLLSVTRVGAQRAPGGAEAPGRLAGLVLELGPGAQNGARPLIEALRFSLPTGVGAYQARVRIEASDDLKHWYELGSAELSWLVNRDTHTLANDRIELPASSFRYARLSWESGAPLLFSRISAEAVTRTEIAAPTDTLLLQAAPGKAGQDLVYQSAPAIPVEKIGLQLAEPNLVLPVQLGRYQELPSRQLGQPSSWHFEPLLRTTFYRITQDGRERNSGELTVPPQHVEQWVLRPQAALGAAPQLRLTWSPSTLLFLANGKEPYTLAFGRPGAPRAALDVAQVAPGFSQGELQALDQARAGALAQRAGASAERSVVAAAGQSANLRLATLWGALALGVGVLGFFSWRLLRQMNGQRDPS